MIRLSNVSKYYSKNQVVSLGLRKVNLELGLNEFVAIVGESGSGKTTLLNVISGIDSYENGELYINEEETSYFSKTDWENYRKKYIAFIFQNYHLIESYTVLQNVEAALILSGYPKEELRQRALEIIDRVGLTDHIKHKATKLSGGQKQRVVIARAIAKDAPIIVADEPTGNLDSESAKNIIDLLAEIAKDKLVIVVTHDFTQVESQATRKIRIYDGEIVEDRKIEKVTPKNLPNLEDKDYKMNAWETIKMVVRNLIATPKKSALLLVIFLFSTFFFAFIYAAFLQTQASQTTSSGLGYEPETRILVNKADGSAFSMDELTSLENDRRVASLLTYDFLLDRNFQFSTSIRIGSKSYRTPTSPIIFPISMFDGIDDELAPGEIGFVMANPDDFFEDSVVEKIPSSDLELTYSNKLKTFDIVQYYDFSEISQYIDELPGYALFVSDEDWEDIGKKIGFNSFTTTKFRYTYDSQNYQTTIGYLSYEIDNTLADDEFNVSVNRFVADPFDTIQADVTFDTFYQTYLVEDATVLLQPSANVIEMNQNTFDQLFGDDIYQISLFANDGIEAINLSERLSNNADYQVFYPAGAESNNQLEGLIFLIMNFGFFFLFAVVFAVIFFISYVVIKNIVNSKLNDYAIFRTIGANKSTIRSFIYLETIFVALVALFVFILTVVIGSPYFVENTWFYVLKFYTFKNIVYLMIFMILFALLLSRRYVSRVYHDTVAETLRREME